MLFERGGGELKGRGKEDLVGGHRRMLCTRACILRVHGEANLSLSLNADEVLLKAV